MQEPLTIDFTNTIDTDIKDLITGNYQNNLLSCLTGQGIDQSIIDQIIALMNSVISQAMAQFSFFSDINQLNNIQNKLSRMKVKKLSQGNAYNNPSSFVQDAKKPIKKTTSEGTPWTNNFSENYPNAYGSTDEAGNFYKVNMQTGEITFVHNSGTGISIDKNGNVSLEIVGSLTANIKDKITINADNDIELNVLGNIKTNVSGNITTSATKIKEIAQQVHINSPAIKLG